MQNQGLFLLDLAHVELKYGFCSPQTGAKIGDNDSQIRKDLKDVPLPPPATAVPVLYLDDATYRVL